MHKEVKILWKGFWILKKTCNKDNFKKKNMNLLTKERHESYENANVCYFYKEKF